MTGTIRRGLVAACVLSVALGGCSNTRRVVSPRPWDKFSDGEVLRVHGADRDRAGQVIYRQLREDPKLRAFFDRQGEPDALEVKGSRWSEKTIVLTYTRQSAGPPRLIILDPSGDTFVPRPAVPIAVESPRPPKKRPTTSRKPKPQRSPAPAEAERPGAPEKAVEGEKPEPAAQREQRPTRAKPSAEQALGCPIDPSRPDCQAFCTPGADHEWCD
jgi:hypothetical protein